MRLELIQEIRVTLSSLYTFLFSKTTDLLFRETFLESTREYDYAMDGIKEPRCNQQETRLRQQVMVKMYEVGYGPTEIGEFFKRDKGAVLYAVRKSRDIE